MRKLLFFLVMLTINIVSFAQNSEPEKAKPMTDTEIVRKCAFLDVEGKYYENVTVTLKSNQPDFIFTDKYKVKVTVTMLLVLKSGIRPLKMLFCMSFPVGKSKLVSKILTS